MTSDDVSSRQWLDGGALAQGASMLAKSSSPAANRHGVVWAIL